MNVRFLLVSACAVILAVTGFAGFQLTAPPEIPVPQNLVVSVDDDGFVQQLPNASLSVQSTVTEVCVLEGDATDKRKCEFYQCLEELSCENPTRYEDEDNGNVVVICR